MKQFFTILLLMTFSSPFVVMGQASSSSEIVPPVTEIPDGATPSVYTQEAVVIQGSNLDTEPTIISGYKTVLHTLDNKVYWKDPIYGSEVGSCLVGEIKDDKIVFDFPQTFYTDTYQGQTGVLYFYPFKYNTEYHIFIQSDTPVVELSIKDDGTIVMPEDVTIGVANPGNLGGYAWAGAGITEVELYPFNATAVTAPESLVFEDWILEDSFGSSVKYVKIGFAGDDVYFKGFSKNCPEFTFKGTLNGNKIICPSNQYMGEYDDHFFVSFMTVNWAPDADRTEHDNPDLVFANKNFVFTVNTDRNALRAEDPEILFIFSASEKSPYPILVVENPYIYMQDELNPKTPQPAYALKVITDDWAYSQTDFLSFSIYDYNINNQYFPRANMSYEIMADGEPFAFTRRNGYPNLKESISLIPLELSNSYFTAGLNKTVAFKTRDYTTLGVRVSYTDTDGTTYYSPISYFPGHDLSSINEADIDSNVVRVDYFDLTGAPADADTAGIIIKKTLKANGTIQVTKIFNR